MAFGSVATSKVKVILEAQDNVTAKLNQLKANFAKADKELQTRIEKERYALAEKMVAWDQKHASPTGWYGFRSNTGQYWKSFEHFTPERTKALGMYNPYISGTSVFLALQTQSSKLYQNAQRFADGLISINQKLSKASAKLFEVGGKLTMSGGIMTGAGIAGLSSLYKPLSDFGDFQRNMLEAQVKSGASAAQYNSMVGAARQYAANSSWDPQQVSSVMAKMSSMGFKPQQITNAFAQIMDYSRAVGQDDPMWAAQGIGAMMNSFGINAANSGMVSKVIDKMTAAIVNSPLRDDTLREAMKQVAPLVKDKMGTIDDMLAWNMVMAQKGIDGSIAGTAQKNFLMRTGNSKIVDYLGKFGIAVFDDAGNRRSARQILADIAQIKKVMTDKEWDDFAFKVFGARSQSGIGAMFDDNALEQAYSSLADSEGLSLQIREQMESGVFGSLKRIWSALQDMFLEIGKSLEVTLKEMEPKIIEWFHWIKEQIENMPSLVERAEKFFEWMVRIGIPVTAIGLAITGIGAVLSGIQTIASALIFSVQNVLWPVISGIAQALTWIFGSVAAVAGVAGGVIVAAFAAILATTVAISAATMRWDKILTGMFNGGGILKGIKMMGWSLWETFKWVMAKVARLLADIIVVPVTAILKAVSYVPGLKVVGKAADALWNGSGWVFDELDKENERTRKEYFKDLDKYVRDSEAGNRSEANDIAKRGASVAMPAPMNDDLFMIQRQQREEQAKLDWERYVQSKDRYAVMPSDLEQAEKIIQRAKDAEMKLAEERVKAAFAADKSAKAEERKAEKERKKAAAKAQAEERRKAEEDRKWKEYQANKLQRQAELTKNLKPIFQGSMEAAKWLHGLGDYSKDGKTDRELAQEQVDHLASIDETLKNGEVVFQGV